MNNIQENKWYRYDDIPTETLKRYVGRYFMVRYQYKSGFDLYSAWLLNASEDTVEFRGYKPSNTKISHILLVAECDVEDIE